MASNDLGGKGALGGTDLYAGRKVFFFEKKKQKTFVFASGAPHVRGLKPREH
jgi:hypothetical protein